MILTLVVLALGTLTYALTLGSFAWEDLTLGLGFSAALLATFWRVLMPSPLPSSGRMLRAMVYFPAFAAVVVRDIVIGTWQVAVLVTGIRPLEHPGIVRVPLGARSKASTGLTGMVLTLSPGTFLLDVDWERREMLVHAIDASDPDGMRAGFDRVYETIQRHVVP